MSLPRGAETYFRPVKMEQGHFCGLPRREEVYFWACTGGRRPHLACAGVVEAQFGGILGHSR